MNELTANPGPAQPPISHLARYLLSAAILLALTAGLFVFRIWTASQQPVSPQVENEIISTSILEERHGIRIKLIGVTGGGGLIDFRFKVLDQEKAGRLLKDPADVPVLVVEDSGTVLKPPDVKPQDIQLENDSVYLILYPNTAGTIKPGTSVLVTIGNVHLEPILAQ
jgi:hypothetical protein